jgi:hypothetical protein
MHDLLIILVLGIDIERSSRRAARTHRASAGASLATRDGRRAGVIASAHGCGARPQTR